MKKITKMLCILMAIILTIYCSTVAGVEGITNTLIPEAAAAEFFYSITGSGTLTVYGSGAMKNYTSSYFAPWGDILSNIRKIVISKGITSIGDYAFSDCSYLQEVVIPDTVTSIGQYAFSRCASLASITIPESVVTISAYAFKNCQSLKTIEISDSVETLGREAFRWCSMLTSAYIGSANVGVGAFSNCSLLTELIVSNNVESIASSAFNECNNLATVYYQGTAKQWNEISIDNVGNTRLIGAKKIYAVEEYDLTVQPGSYQPISGVRVFDKHTYVYSSYINGDVYVREGVTVIFHNTVITGNVYVYGGAFFHGCSIGTLRTGNLAFSYFEVTTSLLQERLPNGYAKLWNTDCYGILSGLLELYDVPCYIYEAVNIDGVLQIKGATLNIAYFYINNSYVPVASDGLFASDTILIDPAAKSVTLTWSAQAGTVTKTLKLNRATKNNDETFSYYPEINPEPVSLDVCQGQKVDLNSFVTVVDKEDGNITEGITYLTDYNENSPAGRYNVVFSVTDSDDLTSELSMTISVKAHKWSQICYEPAQCTADGSEQLECSRCKTTKTEPVAALGHNYEKTVISPTCTDDGYTTHTCSRCKDTYSDSKVKALGHSYKDTVTAPTCTSEGYTTHTCTRCDNTYTDTKVNALGHSYKDTVTAPTCTKEGYTTHTCTRCNNTYTDTKVKVTGHKWGEWKEVLAPTFTANGKEERICSLCKKTESRTTGKLSFNVGDLDGNGNITAADARLALRASVGLENFSDTQKLSADVDNNGNITAADARLILRASVGLETLGKGKKVN